MTSLIFLTLENYNIITYILYIHVYTYTNNIRHISLLLLNNFGSTEIVYSFSPDFPEFWGMCVSLAVCVHLQQGEIRERKGTKE